MTAFNTSNGSAILKTLYPSGLSEVLMPKTPLFALLAKDTAFSGDGRYVALRYAGATGASTDFATAQALKGPGSYSRFYVTRKKEYVLTSIDGEMIRAATDKGSIVRGLKAATDDAMYAFQRSIAAGLYGNGGGALGQISSGSTVGSTTITLANTADVVRFEVGMTVQAATTDGTSGSVESGSVQITAIDYDAGTLTAAANWSTGIGTIATGDYLFRKGDFGNKFTGLGGWIPASAPSSTAFFGVDRSVAPSRLGGLRYSGSGAPIEETLITAANKAAQFGASPDVCMMNNVDFGNLVKARQSKVFVEPRGTTGLGFRALELEGPRGTIDVVPDPDCPKGTSYLLQKDTWTLGSLGACPDFLSDDGNQILRESSADAYEMRIGAYLNLWCDAPGYNMRVTL